MRTKNDYKNTLSKLLYLQYICIKENALDTTEQINGYYFDGKSNLSESELLFWLLMDESYKQFGDLLDYFAWGSMILSIPLVPVRDKVDYRRATRGTSPLSLVFRKVFTGSFETRKKTLTI